MFQDGRHFNTSHTISSERATPPTTNTPSCDSPTVIYDFPRSTHKSAVEADNRPPPAATTTDMQVLIFTRPNSANPKTTNDDDEEGSLTPGRFVEFINNITNTAHPALRELLMLHENTMDIKTLM